MSGTSGSSSCPSTHLNNQTVGERSDSDQDERPGTSLAGDGDAQLTETAHAAGSQLRGTKKRKAKSGYERALQSWSEDQKLMMQEIQDRQNRWAEEQQQHREQRERTLQQQEENLLTRLLEQNSRSTERLVGMMFEGLRSLLPTPQAGPAPPQYNPYPQYRYPDQHQQYHPQPQNFPRRSENPEDESEYTLQRLH
ncbi:myb-like protein Q [Sardina pilchardus]|uniref:myb-like protein Q n=1 Tax=Sardina pilchardus TaxID=27697 RepID=UPI002E10CD96